LSLTESARFSAGNLQVFLREKMVTRYEIHEMKKQRERDQERVVLLREKQFWRYYLLVAMVFSGGFGFIIDRYFFCQCKSEIKKKIKKNYKN